MAFHVGQKVVCVNDNNAHRASMGPPVKRGVVYTIAALRANNVDVLDLIDQVRTVVARALKGKPPCSRPRRYRWTHEYERKGIAMNKERLRKLAQRLDKTPREKFDMRTWCGTKCCIAGHALIMARQRRPAYDSDLDQWRDTIRPAAAEYLGIDFNTGEDLMDCDPFGNQSATPKQAAKVIRHLIKTGKVEWEKFVT